MRKLHYSDIHTGLVIKCVSIFFNKKLRKGVLFKFRNPETYFKRISNVHDIAFLRKQLTAGNH